MGRAQLCGLARKGTVRGGAVIRRRRDDDGVYWSSEWDERGACRNGSCDDRKESETTGFILTGLYLVKLFRENNVAFLIIPNVELTRLLWCVVSPCFWQIFPRGRSAQCPVDRSWCAQRCCDGAATESLLRRRCAGQLRRAHSAPRVSTRRAE